MLSGVGRAPHASAIARKVSTSGMRSLKPFMEARDAAYQLARKVIIPNLRYRDDIGTRVIDHDLAELSRLGYLAP